MSQVDERTPLVSGAHGAGKTAQSCSSDSALGDQSRPQNPSENHQPPPRPFYVILTTCLSLWCITLIVSLDTTVVAMLIGNISSTFREAEKASWIGSTYLLTACCTAPVYGRLCDIIGGKRALNIALTLFAIGTVGCGAARNMTEFLAARSLAGMGGGGLNTVGSVIISHLVPLHSRGVYQGFTNIVYGLGIGIGGPIGGILNDIVGWRAVFYFQVPIIAVALFALLVFVGNEDTHNHEDPRSFWRRMEDIDFLGLVVITMAPLSLHYALDLVSIQDVPLSDWRIMASAAVFALSLICFYFVERFVAHIPLISFEVLGIRSCWSTLWTNFWEGIAIFGYNFNFPLFFQVVGKLPPSVIGERLIPASCTLSLGSLFAGFYMRKTGYYYWYMVTCLVIATLASGRSVLFGSHPPLISPFVYNVVLTFTQAGVITATLIALINNVERRKIGIVTGMNYFFRANGQVLGVALSGGILQVSLLRTLCWRIVGPQAEELISKIRHEATSIPTLPGPFQDAAIESYAIALSNVFLFICACNFLALLNAMRIENKRLPMPSDQSRAPADEESN